MSVELCISSRGSGSLNRKHQPLDYEKTAKENTLPEIPLIVQMRYPCKVISINSKVE